MYLRGALNGEKRTLMLIYVQRCSKVIVTNGDFCSLKIMPIWKLINEIFFFVFFEIKWTGNQIFSRDIHNKLINFYDESYEFRRTSELKKYQITRYLLFLFLFIETNKKSLFATLMNVNNLLLLDIFINSI